MANIIVFIKVQSDNPNDACINKQMQLQIPLEHYRPVFKEGIILNTIDTIYDELKRNIQKELTEETNSLLQKDGQITAINYEGLSLSEYLALKAKIIRGLPNG